MQTFKTYADSTLKQMTKKELIELLRIAEHNRATAEAFNEQQYQNMKDWAPVVHSKWVFDDNGRLVCEHCKGKALRDDIGIAITSEYCPSCGADMTCGKRIKIQKEKYDAVNQSIGG